MLFLDGVCIRVDVYWYCENLDWEKFIVAFDKFGVIVFMRGDLIVICSIGFSVEEKITVIIFPKLGSRR